MPLAYTTSGHLSLSEEAEVTKAMREMTKVSHDIANGGVEFDEADIDRVSRAMDAAFHKWSYAIGLPEPLFVELHDMEGALKHALQENRDRIECGNTREECRIYHDENASKSAAAMGGA
jgi:hypothetical protein